MEFPDHLDFMNWSKVINKESRNMPKSRNGLPTFLEKDYLDKNISIMSLKLAPKIQNFPVHQCHEITTLEAKNGKV